MDAAKHEHNGHDVRLSPYDCGHDAIFCMTCDLWLEPKCSDPDCEFCANRPEKPSMMPKGLLDASKSADW